jgi:DNA-binding NtrC family response regulator
MTRLGKEMRPNEIPVIDQLTLRSLTQYHWPGNVPEPHNVSEPALMLSEETRLHVTLPSYPPDFGDWSQKVRFSPDGEGMDEMLDRLVQSACLEALRPSQGRGPDTAELLRIFRTARFRHMVRLEIEGENETCPWEAVRFSDTHWAVTP